MKNFTMVILALPFVACASSPSQESRHPASDDHDPRYLALPIAQKIEIRQAQWSNVLMTVAPRCIPGWNEKYAREFPPYIEQLKRIAENNEIALSEAFAKIEQIKVTPQYRDRCYVTDDSLRQMKEKLDAIKSARDVVKKASDSLHGLQSRGMKRFSDEIGREYQRSLTCLRQKYYDDAVHVTFMTHPPGGGQPIDNGFDVAEDAIMAAAQRVSKMEEDLLDPCGLHAEDR
jgi:hypothetical protein